MATYVYETIPSKSGEKSRTFEVRQSMKDAPLTHDPESGLPVRRVISGGFGLMMGAGAPSSAPAPSGHSCGHSGCCH